LENRRSENDKVLRRVWEAVEAKIGKIMVGKTKGRRKERNEKKKSRRKKKPKRERIMEVKKIVEE